MSLPLDLVRSIVDILGYELIQRCNKCNAVEMLRGRCTHRRIIVKTLFSLMAVSTHVRITVITYLHSESQMMVAEHFFNVYCRYFLPFLERQAWSVSKKTNVKCLPDVAPRVKRRRNYYGENADKCSGSHGDDDCDGHDVEDVDDGALGRRRAEPRCIGSLPKISSAKLTAIEQAKQYKPQQRFVVLVGISLNCADCMQYMEHETGMPVPMPSWRVNPVYMNYRTTSKLHATFPHGNTMLVNMEQITAPNMIFLDATLRNATPSSNSLRDAPFGGHLKYGIYHVDERRVAFSLVPRVKSTHLSRKRAHGEPENPTREKMLRQSWEWSTESAPRNRCVFVKLVPAPWGPKLSAYGEYKLRLYRLANGTPQNADIAWLNSRRISTERVVEMQMTVVCQGKKSMEILEQKLKPFYYERFGPPIGETTMSVDSGHPWFNRIYVSKYTDTPLTFGELILENEVPGDAFLPSALVALISNITNQKEPSVPGLPVHNPCIYVYAGNYVPMLLNMMTFFHHKTLWFYSNLPFTKEMFSVSLYPPCDVEIPFL